MDKIAMATKTKGKTPINVRLDNQVKCTLQEIANTQQRTLSNLVMTILTDYVKKAKK